MLDGSTLEIVGGVDSTLWKDPAISLRFGEVSYIECPISLSHPRLRLGTEQERLALGAREAIEPEQRLYVFEAESMGALEPQSFYVVAESLSVTRL